QRHRHVVNRNAAAGLAFRGAAVGVAVEHGRYAVALQWLGETAATQKGENLPRLAFDRVLDRRIVEDGDALGHAPTGQGRFQFHCLVHRFLHETLDDVFAPGAEGGPAETAGEALHTREADALDLAGVAVEHAHTGVEEDFPNLVLLTGLEIVI